MYSLLWFAFIGFCLCFASFVCHVILSLTFFFVILRFGRVYGIHINDDINDDNYAIDVIRDDELSDDEDEDDEDVYAGGDCKRNNNMQNVYYVYHVNVNTANH